MLKTYCSSSEICINVRVGDNNIHLSFTPLTLGGSTFTTSDANMQNAIEKHRFFGTRVKLMPMDAENHAEENHDMPDSQEKPEVLHFSSIADAKEYCADTFGISRTMLRSSAQIIQLAAEKGYVLEIEPPNSYTGTVRKECGSNIL